MGIGALLLILGITTFVRLPVSEAYIIGQTTERNRSTVYGIYYFSMTESGAVLAPILGLIIDHFGFYNGFTIASVAIAVVVLACSRSCEAAGTDFCQKLAKIRSPVLPMWSASTTVRTRIIVSGDTFLVCRVASKPFNTGISISIMTHRVLILQTAPQLVHLRSFSDYFHVLLFVKAGRSA